MAERPMETTLCTAVWQQFGAAIDMLENALLACPDALWQGRLWGDPRDPSLPPGFASFWYVTSHTLFWLDLYLTGSSEGFAPPAPFNPDDDLPERPYTREELHTYLLQLRQKCQTTITELSNEQAQQQVDLPWRRKPSYLELLLYTLRHVQEHAARASPLSRSARHPGRSARLGRASEGGSGPAIAASGRDHRTDTCLPALTSNVFCPLRVHTPRVSASSGEVPLWATTSYHQSVWELGWYGVYALWLKNFCHHMLQNHRKGSRDGSSTAGDAGNRTAR